MEWKYKYRIKKQDRVRRRDRSVKGRGYWPMIPGGGSACVDSLINVVNVQDIAVGWR